MQFKTGYGPKAVVQWDTDWSAQAKDEKLRALDVGSRLDLLKDMVAKRARAGVEPDLDLVLRTTVAALGNWPRSQFHTLRGIVVGLNRPEDARRVENALRASVQAADTGGSAPQKKTPAGCTRVINMNYRLNIGKRSNVQFQHAQFFAEQARDLGLGLCILADQDAKKDLLGSGVLVDVEVRWKDADEVSSEWAEDSVEFLQSGVVAVLEQFSDAALREGLAAGRQARWAALADPAYAAEIFDPVKSMEWVAEGLKVNGGRTRETQLSVAARQNRRSARLRCYIEGGNLIVGEDAAGRTVALVGRDSIAATRGEYAFTDDDAVVALIAEDFGLARDQVIPVEQPGKFHLDMGLLFLGSGVVVVNDSAEELAAARVALARFDMDSNRKLVARLVLQCGLEDLAVADLAAKGIKVLRHKLEKGANCNFFNGEFVADRAGDIHYLTNGAGKESKPIEDAFVKLLVDERKVAKSVRLSPATAASESLASQGGVGCRIKGAPLPR